MGAVNVDLRSERTQLNIYRYLLFRYEDDSGDFIEQVVTKIRHGFTTLTHPESKMQSKQWKQLGSPPPKTLRGSIQQGRRWPQLFWIVNG